MLKRYNEMQPVLIKRLRIGLLIAAVLLSALEGLGSGLFTPLWFGYPRSTSLRVAIVAQAVLWIPALACSKFPRTGLLAFIALLAIAGILVFNGVNSGSRWAAAGIALEQLEYAIVACVLLVLNFVLISKERAVT